MASISNSFSNHFQTKEVLHNITLGVVKSLENRPGVAGVRLTERAPAESQVIDMWEQKNMCKLPDDLKNFYLTTDGMLIQWNAKFNGSILQLGRMEINPIASLSRVGQDKSLCLQDNPSLMDIDSDSDKEDEQGNIKPHFDERNRIYELDSCFGFGKVIVVYKTIKAGFTTCLPEIWFLDRALQWFYLADSFTNYFRMMMVHLGLPCWQYLFTDSGLTPETRQWFHLFAPHRPSGNLETQFIGGLNESEKEAESSVPTNKLDGQRLFKGRNDKRKVLNEHTKSKGVHPKSKGSTTFKQSKISRSPQRY